jgi:3-deoxy-D-manno-octulosonate 8-phosphate phosphatase (KDO 8-P phosphatase)
VADTKTLEARCLAIELLVIDVDGVLTDGGIMYTDQGVELKQFHVRDGSGLVLWQRLGKQAAIISGRSSPTVAKRAAELKIGPVYQGSPEKLPAYRELLATGNWKPEQACCIGDDVPDLVLLANCGLAVAVADACPQVKAEAHYVTRAAGGRGAVREVIELILGCQGEWTRVVEQIRGQRLETEPAR